MVNCYIKLWFWKKYAVKFKGLQQTVANFSFQKVNGLCSIDLKFSKRVIKVVYVYKK